MDTCIFCKISQGEIPSWKVYENETTYAFLDIHPAAPYHTLVIPKKHYTNIFDIPEAELLEILKAVKTITTLYTTKLGIENVQILNNSGPEAQQDVFHIHFHIVPRKTGDGQDIVWKTPPEHSEHFDAMLQKLSN